MMSNADLPNINPRFEEGSSETEHELPVEEQFEGVKQEHHADMHLRGGRIFPLPNASQSGKSSQQEPPTSHVVNDASNTESYIALETLTEALRASWGRS